MSFPVTYCCPHCGALVELRREGYLADKAVTPFPFEGWEYAAPDEAFEAADGVRFVCGDSEASGQRWTPSKRDTRDDERGSQGRQRGVHEDADAVGCGEQFYLSFVRFVDGEEVDPRNPAEYVDIRP